MIHGFWREGVLTLWGEDAAAEKRTRAAEHPFAAAVEDLAAAIGGPATQALASEATLSLPTRARCPLDSPELVRDEPPGSDRGTVTLASWRVPALTFDPDEALMVLQTPHDEDTVFGASTRHLMELAGFARDLVARGRLLPTIDEDGAGWWRPVLTGPDAVWAQALALALPPSARAGGGSVAEVVGDALDALVDAAARAVLTPIKPGKDAWRQWLAGLGADRTVRVPPAAVPELARALRDWQRDAVAGRVRACFRLTEPPETDENPDTWRLEFALQAADQPSLLVNADKVWGARGSLKALKRHLDDPQETLLAELGRASRLYGELDDSLRTAKPTGLDLDPDGAHRFLREGAPVLAGAGFGVLLPGWWSKPRARLGARLSASTPTAPGTVAAKSSLGLQSLVDYKWELALGDEPLTEDELKALTELRSPLVRLRGQWVELDAKRLAAGLKLLTAAGRMTVADLLQAGLSTEDGPGGLPVVSVTAAGPLGDLLAGQVERRLEPVPAPVGFTGILRPYQERGLAWLTFLEGLGMGSILADDMGLGKSATVLALLLGRADEEAPTLLVCPMSLVGNWQREVTKFAPKLRVHVHHGAERARGKKVLSAVDGADLVITTYALAARDAAALAEVE
ncbi:MAG TPA: SNF2 helicase-associated domain-containing protein, partial [Actinomycetota bacterium]|nr:SNF2 helicase-associated domain-containing protein [Actinomycetota bacterium]